MVSQDESYPPGWMDWDEIEGKGEERDNATSRAVDRKQTTH